MSQSYQFDISQTALVSLQDIESFKTVSMGTEGAAEFTDGLLRDSLAAIAEDPERYRINGMLAEMGLSLRERIDPSSQYRVFYDIEGSTVEILFFISMKQDLEKALYRFMMAK
ncbi:type II toxin-antitoxin system RelE/ParE family toxin [Rouxiella sp. T17]|uniref:type II toxin-antitoxin system RelE/ParE family toxin n=1 Tax=Rouxiella sp. T17 TaxID=3085684 RepID=UPI002FC834CF